MDQRDFEGSLVLEQLAAIGSVEEFFEASTPMTSSEPPR
jgi:hypothetical protein